MPAGLAPETMLPEPGAIEGCMGPVVRGSPTGCCSWGARRGGDAVIPRGHSLSCGEEEGKGSGLWVSEGHPLPFQENNQVALKPALPQWNWTDHKG